MKAVNILKSRIEQLELENKVLNSSEITDRIKYYKVFLSEYKRYGQK